MGLLSFVKSLVFHDDDFDSIASVTHQPVNPTLTSYFA